MTSDKKKIKIMGENNEQYPRDADFSKLEQVQDANEEEESQEATVTEEAPEPQEPTQEEECCVKASELEKYQEEVKEAKTKYLRALADFENYKKRALKERSELLKYQGEKIFADILEIVDNLELALQHTQAEPEKLKDGVELIYKMFVDVLAKWEVHADSGLGKEFDPNVHSAISRVPAAGMKAGTIINELKKAYFYKDRLLRAADVVVAVEVEGEEGAGQDPEPDLEEVGFGEDTKGEDS